MVFAAVADPVGDGLIASLRRPGGNVTGLTIISGELSAKRLELLSEVFPKTSRVALLYVGTLAGASLQVAEAKRAAESLGKTLLLHPISRPEDLPRAFADIRAQHAEALLVAENPMLFGVRGQLIDLAAKNNFPAIAAARLVPLGVASNKFPADSGSFLFRDLFPFIRSASVGPTLHEHPLAVDSAINPSVCDQP